MDEENGSKVVSGWVRNEVAAHLRQVAKDQDRSVSYLVGKLVEDWYANQVEVEAAPTEG